MMKASGSGILAMQVRRGAGLERYGLFAGDMILIGFGDPEPDGPAFAAVNDRVVVGWYKPRRDGRIAIIPFVKGTPPVVAGVDDVQVACELKAIACSFAAHVAKGRV